MTSLLTKRLLRDGFAIPRWSVDLLQVSPTSSGGCLLLQAAGASNFKFFKDRQLTPPKKFENVVMPERTRLPLVQRTPLIWQHGSAMRPPRQTKELWRMRGEETVHTDFKLGQFGIVAVAGGMLKYKQFEAIRLLADNIRMDPFDFGRFFRGFLGLGNRDENVFPPFQRYNDREGDETFQHEERIPEDVDPNQNIFTFRVFTDPLEIHKFFEREMEQMLKDFGGLGGIMGQHKMLDEFPSRFEELPDSGNQTDRDLMLKPESEIVSPKFGGRVQDELREDRDIDDENITSDQLHQLFKDKETPITDNGRINPSDDGHKDGSHLGGGFGSPGSGFRFNSYSFSRSIRTVQKPDGTIETEERTRNPDGTESVIIKRRVGSQEETIHQEGPLVPYADGCPPHHHQPDLPNLFSHLFSGMLGGRGRDGPAHGRDEMLPPAPPADRMFSSLFSQFFGDQRR